MLSLSWISSYQETVLYSTAVLKLRPKVEVQTDNAWLKLTHRHIVLGPHHYFSKLNELSALKVSEFLGTLEKSHQNQDVWFLLNN